MHDKKISSLQLLIFQNFENIHLQIKVGLQHFTLQMKVLNIALKQKTDRVF